MRQEKVEGKEGGNEEREHIRMQSDKQLKG